MISKEINVYGYLKIPYPYLEDYLKCLNDLKGKKSYVDFPDFISPPMKCINNAISSFCYTMRYEPQFEQILIERFETLLGRIKFLNSSIIIDIENKEYFFFEYVSDGAKIYKTVNQVIPAST